MIQHFANAIQENETSLPALLELRSKNQWANSDAQKAPRTPDGGYAKVNDENTWSSYEEVKQAYDRSQLNGRKFTGLGFIFAGDLIFFDYDGCRNPQTGEIEEWALEGVKKIDTYWEISTSGTGLHGYAKGKTPDIDAKDDEGNPVKKRWSSKITTGKHKGVEIYSDKRFGIVTGNHLEGTSTGLKDCTILAYLLYIESKEAELKAKERRGEDREFVPTPLVNGAFITDAWTDEELIERAMKAKNSEKFNHLWDGDFEEAGFGSQSEADESLCMMLAFWTGRNKERIDRLFRLSGLYRPNKWDRSVGQGELYGERTVRKSVENCTDVFTPRVESAPQSSIYAPNNITDKQLLSYEEDEHGHALAAKDLYGDRILYTAAYGWMIYTGTHWDKDEQEPEVNRMIIDTLIRRRLAGVRLNNKDFGKQSYANNSKVNGVRSRLADIMHCRIEAFDNEPDLLNVANGVLNLKTGELVPHSFSQKFTYCIPVEYDPTVGYADIQSFLASAGVGGDVDLTNTEHRADAKQEVIDFMQRAVGYSLTGLTSDEFVFYAYGPGRSGKGTFTESMLELMPNPLSKEVDFNTFTRKREGDEQNFDLAGLKASRLIFASESNKYQTLNPAKIKHFTGGNEVRCAEKFGKPFEFRPHWKIWLVSNHPVKADVDDTPMWGRVQVITFPNSHQGNPDPSVKRRMKSPEMLKQWLAWAVEGARLWYQEGSLPKVEAITETTQKQREDQDSVKLWVDDCITITKLDSDFEDNAHIMSSYSAWCRDNEIEPKSQIQLTTALKIKGLKAGEQKRVGSLVKKGCKGIKINTL